MSDKLRNIERAQRITERVFEELVQEVGAGWTEVAVRDRLLELMERYGASGQAFEPRVGAGRSAADPHVEPGQRKLRSGQLLLIDLGAMYGGYCADMTRMVAIGKPSDEARKVYRTVLRAQEAAIRAAKPGVTGRELDAVARQVIERAGYGRYFIHALGHGVGRKVHQHPRISPVRSGWLKAGDVITVEPGIYLPGRFGVRVEDMLLITPRGNRNLTRTPKRLRVL